MKNTILMLAVFSSNDIFSPQINNNKEIPFIQETNTLQHSQLDFQQGIKFNQAIHISQYKKRLEENQMFKQKLEQKLEQILKEELETKQQLETLSQEFKEGLLKLVESMCKDIKNTLPEGSQELEKALQKEKEGSQEGK